jgi:hypothetical protein
MLQDGGIGEFLNRLDHALQAGLLPGVDGPLQQWSDFGAAAAPATKQKGHEVGTYSIKG